MLRELLAADLHGKRVLVAGVNDPAACNRLAGVSVGEHVEFDLGVNEDEVSAAVPVAGALSVVGQAAMASGGQLHTVVPATSCASTPQTSMCLSWPRNVQYGTMEQFAAAGVDFHDYDIVVVKMGYLDTYLIPETAFHVMALTDGPTIQRSSTFPSNASSSMWPIDDMDELVYIE